MYTCRIRSIFHLQMTILRGYKQLSRKTSWVSSRDTRAPRRPPSNPAFGVHFLTAFGMGQLNWDGPRDGWRNKTPSDGMDTLQFRGAHSWHSMA